MAYLKEQQPINLANVAGVPVTLTAKAPDGSTVNIGSVTSDASGYFSTAWAPTSAGMYRITASFGSTDSYGSSSAETSLYAVAGQGSQVSTVAVTSNTDMYIVISTSYHRDSRSRCSRIHPREKIDIKTYPISSPFFVSYRLCSNQVKDCLKIEGVSMEEYSTPQQNVN